MDDAPQHQGALPNSSATMAATLLALRAPLPPSIYMCTPHLPNTTVMSFSTPLYSVPTTPHNDGVAKIAPSHCETSTSSSWLPEGTPPLIHNYFDAFIIVSNVVNQSQRPNAHLDTTKALKPSMMTQQLLLKISMLLRLNAILTLLEASLKGKGTIRPN